MMRPDTDETWNAPAVEPLPDVTAAANTWDPDSGADFAVYASGA